MSRFDRNSSHRKWLRVVCGVCGLLFAACANPPESLTGSISQAFDLSFSSVAIAENSQAFQVSYLRSDGNEIVMRITVDTTGITLKGGQAIDLSGDYATGHPRTTVTRAVANEPLRVLPPLQNGSMTLGNSAKTGQDTSGSFAMTFSSAGDLGGGYTLNGTFAGLVVLAP